MSKFATANKTIESLLDRNVRKLEKLLNADVLAYSGAITDWVDDGVRDAIESRKNKRNDLAVILETPGGSIEVTERIVGTIRHHYQGEVAFYIPGAAMSAGTVLVMSGDSIHMDYYSRLGPIDPQIQRPGAKMWVPALGYLIQYERLIAKDAAGTLTTAEAAILIERFDQAELYLFEQAREQTVTLLKEWLVKYKFKNWQTTRDRNLPVSEDMKRERAAQIANMLNQTERWHSHARGISMDILQKELNVQIEDYGRSPELRKALRSYHKLFTDYMLRRNQSEVIHTRGRYAPVMET